MTDRPPGRSLDDLAYENLAAAFGSGGKGGEQTLSLALRYLGKWRQAGLDAELFRKFDGKVFSGPFRGMAFVSRGTHGSLAPKLLGTYEHELHSVIETIIAAGYEAVLNIGAAEGYYAVGLALRMRSVQVFAYDSDPGGQQVCARVAAANGVADRIFVGELFQPEDFAGFADKKKLVICDIEGSERELLRPDNAPALKDFDLLVECHDPVMPGVTDEIARRFEPTHVIERIEAATQPAKLPGNLSFADEFDALIARWEWRMGRTVWLWMRARQPSG